MLHTFLFVLLEQMGLLDMFWFL